MLVFEDEGTLGFFLVLPVGHFLLAPEVPLERRFEIRADYAVARLRVLDDFYDQSRRITQVLAGALLLPAYLHGDFAPVQQVRAFRAVRPRIQRIPDDAQRHVREHLFLQHGVKQPGGTLQTVKIQRARSRPAIFRGHFAGSSGFLQEGLALRPARFRIHRGAVQKQGFTLRHIAGMAMQGNPPILARDHLIRPQHLNLDQLLEGRLEGLHQPRQVLGRI